MQNSCVLMWKRSWKVWNLTTALRNFWVSAPSSCGESAGHCGWGSHSAVQLRSPFKRTSLESPQAFRLRPCSPQAVDSQWPSTITQPDVPGPCRCPWWRTFQWGSRRPGRDSLLLPSHCPSPDVRPASGQTAHPSYSCFFAPLSFIGALPNKSLTCLILSWHLLLRGSKLTQWEK